MPKHTLDSRFADFQRPNAPGATVLVVRSGEILLAKGFGLANLEDRIPCKPTTNFRLASLSKQFTAMAIMILAERHKLGFHETLPDFFPEFPKYGHKISVLHLLNHSSGLSDYEELIPKGTALPVLDRDVLRLLMGQTRTRFSPGTKYRYSNSAYALLALTVEVRSGAPFARFLKENIFQPLKMNTTLAYEQGLSIIPNRAYGYSKTRGGFKRTDQNLTSSVLGDGGVYSSVSDLFRWDQALSAGELIGPAMLRRAFTPAIRTERPNTGYGFGWYIGVYRGLKEIWHHGETIGFTTRIARYPEKKFTVVILANRSEAELSPLLHRVTDSYLFP